MDKELSELKDQIEELRQEILYQSTVINKLILLINIANTDLKNHLDLLD
jgi:hypothetical protein